MHKNSRILISGAGIAGLSCAIRLGLAGFKPVVIEKAEDIRADGFIISLSHKAYTYADRIGILPELIAASAGIKNSAYIDRNGNTMLELDYQRLFNGVNIVQLMRDDLETVLYNKARELVDIRFSTTISDIQSGEDYADITFNNGSMETFDVVIGADGLASNTRSLAFDDGMISREYFGLFSAAYRLKNILGLEQRFENHMEQNRYMCVYTTRENELACVFIWKCGDTSPPDMADRFEFLQSYYRNAPAVVNHVLDACPEDKKIYMDPLIQIKLDNWSTGRIVLLGDAAHCLTLLSGQGASSAMWGGAELATGLIETGFQEACKRYQATLEPVILQLQKKTSNAAKWYIPGKPLNYYTRDTLMKILPNPFFQSYFRKKYTSA